MSQSVESKNFMKAAYEFITNSLPFRKGLSGYPLNEGERDLYGECKYPRHISIRECEKLFRRSSVANRCISIYPNECWKIQPLVYETEDTDISTPFEKSFNTLQEDLKGDNWYIDDEDKGSPFWEAVAKADTLSRIGQYGILVLGINDGKDLREPVEPKKYGSYKLSYLRAFDQTKISITSVDSDRTSKRYGMPTSYSVEIQNHYNDGIYNKSEEVITNFDTAVEIATIQIHWTRVIHLCDNGGATSSSSDVYTNPVLAPVYNNIVNLEKLYGSSAEGYWQAGFPGIGFEIHPGLNPQDLDLTDALNSMKEQMERYTNSLQRTLTTVGVSAKTFAPAVIDPAPFIESQLESVCIYLECPKRIFAGSERGELASSQDKDTWKEKIRARYNKYLTPKVIVPLVNRLIYLGLLEQPSEGFFVHWSSDEELTEKDKSEIARTRTEALSTYVEKGLEAIISRKDYLTKIMYFSEEEADAIIETADDYEFETSTEITQLGDLTNE